MYKKIMMALIVLTICGCASKQEEINVKQETEVTDKAKQAIDHNEDNTMFIKSQIDYAIDISDPNALNEIADGIALVKIDSIDGGTCTNPETGDRLFIHTIGKMTIIESFKGSYESNQQLTYYRPGGVVSYEEYYNSLKEAQKMKADLNENRPEYVSMYMADDIQVEEGKTYLAYFCSSSIQDTVGIAGFAGGLREYKEGSVLNNFSGKFVPLKEALPK